MTTVGMTAVIVDFFFTEWIEIMMTSKSDKVLAAIAKFTYLGFKRRDNFTEGWYLTDPIQILIIQILVYFPLVIIGLW